MKTDDRNISTILIVDDDPDIHELYKYAFENEGFSYLGALTVVHAMNILETSTVELIIVDGMLPDISGANLCQMIRLLPKYKKTPVIFFSAYFRDIAVMKNLFVDLGINLVLPKPQKPESLIHHTKHLLGKSNVDFVSQTDYDEAFANIRAMYIQSFLQQLSEIEIIMNRIDSGKADREDFIKLRHYVHKIHGSAGSYGYTLVSYISGKWEKELDSIITSTDIPPAEKVHSFKTVFEKIKVCFQLPDDLPENKFTMVR